MNKYLYLLIILIISNSAYTLKKPYSQKNIKPIFNSNPLWILKSKKKIISSPVGSKGIIYFGDLNNHVYAVHAKKGSVIWYKKLKSNKNPIGIYRSPLIYKNMLIVVNGDGYVYAFNKNNGQLIWKPKNLEEQVYSSPVIKKGYIFITTAEKGHLWIINAKNGELFFKKPIKIGSPVYVRPIVEANHIKNTNGFNLKKTKTFSYFRVHMIAPYKIISYNIFPSKKYSRLKDINIKAKTLSEPVKYLSSVYFINSQFLYCLKLKPRYIAWIKRINFKKEKPIHKINIPSPLLTPKTIFIKNRAYNTNNGSIKWIKWIKGEVTNKPAISSDILYIGGRYTLYNKLYGFVAGINIVKDRIIFWYSLPKPIISPIYIYNKMLYFTTDDKKLFALK